MKHGLKFSTKGVYFNDLHILPNKRLLLFAWTNLFDEVRVAGGEISWSLLRNVHEKDAECQGNLRAAPKLSKTVLHPGNCKQSVPVPLAIFDPSTRAAILKYFPQVQDSADFINLFHTWWMVSNSKQRFRNGYRLGDAAVEHDVKPIFLRKFSEWLQEWQNEKLPNSERFGLSAQISSALIHTSKCQAALIEDLLREGYKYVLTIRFQSDPLEKKIWPISPIVRRKISRLHQGCYEIWEYFEN